MKKFITPLLLLLLIIPTLSNLFAQQTINWENHNTFSSVKCMLDMDTAILAGTNGGLTSINKTSLAVSYIGKVDSLIPGVTINCLEKDPFGNVWIGTNCGLTKYHAGIWTNYNTQNSVLPSDCISSLYYSNLSGSLLVGLCDGNVLTITPTGWTVLVDTSGLKPMSRITAIVTETANDYWVGTSNNGVYKWDGDSWTGYDQSNSPVENAVYSLIMDSNTKLWVANNNQLVSHLDTTWEIHAVTGCSDLRHMSIDNNNLITISSRCGILSFDGTAWASVTAGISLTDSVLMWHIIDNNNTWTGTQSHGIDQVSQSQTVTNVPLKPDMIYPGVRAIKFEVSSKANIAYDSENEASLSNYNGTTGAWAHYSPANTVLGSSPITALQMQSTKLWIATFGDGVFTKSGNTWTTFTTANSNLASDSATALTTNSINSVLIGFNNGAVQVKGAYPGFSSMVSANLVNSRINRILVGTNSNNWLATETVGLACYNGTGLSFFNMANSDLPSNKLFDIRQDVYHNLWIATDSGLVSFDGTSAWHIYNTTNSDLPEDYITTVCIGKDSSIWVGTRTSGISRYKDSVWTNYNTCNSPLVSDNIKIIETAPNGKVFVGTGNGLSIIISGTATGLTVFENPSNANVYPNPGSDKIHFDFEIPGATKGVFRLYNAFGQLVLTEAAQFGSNGRFNYTWDIAGGNSKTKPGLYFYTIQGDFNTQSGKVVVAR